MLINVIILYNNVVIKGNSMIYSKFCTKRMNYGKDCSIISSIRIYLKINVIGRTGNEQEQ
jgi:hypothetical protein